MLLYKSGINGQINESVKLCEKLALSDVTTYGLGGEASKVYFPKTPYQVKRIYGELKSCGENIAVIGNGSNILASDKGFCGSVICLREMQGILRLDETKILCLAGTNIGRILKYCKERSLSGIEYMYGIPASIGGAAYMNAGIGSLSISENIVHVGYFGDICGNISLKECNFGYKHSTMRDINGIILTVALNLKSASPQEIDEKLNYFKLKRAHLPKGRSCGCVFKNGENYSAGELIDKAGLKGQSLGGAYISPKHANFIINVGGCASDVQALISMVKRRVLQQFGVELQEEVVYIGDFK